MYPYTSLETEDKGWREGLPNVPTTRFLRQALSNAQSFDKVTRDLLNGSGLFLSYGTYYACSTLADGWVAG